MAVRRWPDGRSTTALPILPVGVVSLVVAACAGTPVGVGRGGEVALKAVIPEHAERMALGDDQVFQLGRLIPDSRALPDYPGRLLDRPLPVTPVCVELHIDPDGDVYEAVSLVDGEACPALDPELAEAFVPAAIAAVREWRFEPSYLCLRAPGMIYDDCEDALKEREAVALTLAYRFEFRQIDGRGTVSVGPGH